MKEKKGKEKQKEMRNKHTKRESWNEKKTVRLYKGKEKQHKKSNWKEKQKEKRIKHKERVKMKRETNIKKEKKTERVEMSRKQKEAKEDEWWMFCVNYVNHGCPTCQSFSKWHEQLFNTF
jgi:hypothetical protein